MSIIALKEEKSPVQCIIPDVEACINQKYTDEEIAMEQESYANNVVIFNRFQVVNGKVVRVSRRNVVLDIGYKSDGFIPFNEVRYLESIKPGDILPVYIESKEDKSGQLLISHKKALLIKAWDQIMDSLQNKTILEGIVESISKGGVIVNIQGIKCFLPTAQIENRRILDLDSYVGKMIDLIVLKVNIKNNNVVVSHKAIIEKDLEAQRDKIYDSLEKGFKLKGVVKNILDYGAFVDLGGVDGLLHLVDICWERIKHPSEKLTINQSVDVIVLDLQDDNKKISLGMKQLTPHPWDTLSSSLKEGDVFEDKKIVCKLNYGIFVEIFPGIEGLIHVNEISWSSNYQRVMNSFEVGGVVSQKVVISSIDREQRKVALSIKQLIPNPWKSEDFENKYKPGNIVKGEVIKIVAFGAFVELEPGVDGLLYKKDISWQENDVEFNSLNIGDKIDVKILSSSKDDKKISLSKKHLTKNPLEEYSEKLQKGSIVNGIVTKFRKDEFVAVKLDVGDIEVSINKDNLAKQGGGFPKVGDSIALKVLDLVIDEMKNPKIYLSHKATYLE